MNKGGIVRTLVSLVVAAAIVLLIYFTVPPTPFSPRGVLLPTGKQPTTSIGAVPPEQIVLFSNETAPSTYEVLGYVNIEYHVLHETVETQPTLYLYAKTLASKVKANGIIVTLFGHTVPGKVPKSMSFYVFRGLAVYFPQGD